MEYLSDCKSEAERINSWDVWIEQWYGRLYLARPCVILKDLPFMIEGKWSHRRVAVSEWGENMRTYFLLLEYTYS